MTAVELRPMSLGEILDRSFSLYRNHFLLFVGIAALPHLFVLLMNLVTQGIGEPARPSGAVAVAVFGALFFFIAYLGAVILSQAATVFAISDVHLGRETTIGSAYGRVRGHFWQLIGVMMVVGLAVGAGLLLLIVPGIYLMLRFSLSIPAAVLEDTTVIGALERSGMLTDGSKTRIFLVILMVWVLTFAAVFVFQFPIGVVTGVMMAQGNQPPIWLQTLSHILEFVSNSLVAPVGTIAFALIYYDERVRKEAFDLQLMMQTLDGTPPAGGIPPPDQGGVVPRQFS